MLNDAAVRKGSESFVRVIIRRPHAYAFRDRYRGKNVPIPGLAFLDVDGKLLAISDLADAGKLAEQMKILAKEP